MPRLNFSVNSLPRALLIAAVFFCTACIPSAAHAATITWGGGGSTNNWTECANWVGGVCPSSADSVVFNTTSTKNSTIDATATSTVAGIFIDSTYSGTLTVGRAMSIGSTTLAGGTFSLGSNAVTLTGNFTHASGNTFTAGTGSVIFSGNAFTYTGNTTFYDLTLQAGNAVFSDTIAAATTFTVSHNFYYMQGYLNTGSITMGAGATVFASSTAGSFGTATLVFGQTGNETIQCDTNANLPAVYVNKPSGTLSYNCSNLNMGSTTIASGTFSVGSNSLTLGGNFTHNPSATFDAGTGSVIFNANAATYTGNTTFYDLTYQAGNAAFSATIAAATTFTVNHSFHYVLGYLNTGTISMGAGATVFASSTNTNLGTATLVFAQTGNEAIQCDSGGSMLMGLFVNKPSGTLSYNCNSLIVGSTTIASGTFSVGANSLTIEGNANQTGGTLNGGTGTVVFKGSFSTYTGAFSLYKVDISANTNGITNTLAQGSSITAQNTLRFVEGLLNTGTTTAQGDVTVLSTYDGGNAPLVFSGSATQTFDLTGGTGLYDGKITVNKTGGQVNLASALVMDAASQNLAISAGTFNLNGNNLTVSGAGATFVVQNGGTFALNGGELTTAPVLAASSTIEYNGSDSYTTLPIGSAYSNLSFTGSGSWATSTNITVGGSFNQTSGTFTESGTLTFSSTTASAIATTSAETTITNLILNKSGQSLTLAGSGLTLGGNLTLTAGTLDPSVNGCSSASCPITLAGSWLGGNNLFTPRSDTVTFNGTSQSITGTTTFNNLSKIVSSADTLAFGANQTQTISGTWVTHGAASNLLALVSNSPGTQWMIDPQSTRTLSYLSVQDSNNTNASVIAAGGLNISDISNNTNWTFTSPAPVVETPTNTGGGGIFTGSVANLPGYIKPRLQIIYPDGEVVYLDTPSVSTPTAPSTSTQTQSSIFSFSQNHRVGDTGEDIHALQQFLNTHGYSVAESGAGSPGNETTTFGAKTYQALIKFQKAHGLPPTGYFGPMTRRVIDSL